MQRILFICHGNICRSPMAEFIFKKMVKDADRENDFLIASAAAHTDAIGQDMYGPARKKLSEKGIPYSPRRARQITFDDYQTFDLLIGMDDKNISDMKKLWHPDPDNKIKLLTVYAGKHSGIADPWYTGDFERTWLDLNESLSALLASL